MLLFKDDPISLIDSGIIPFNSLSFKYLVIILLTMNKYDDNIIKHTNRCYQLLKMIQYFQ